jgi:hypothetical protein
LSGLKTGLEWLVHLGKYVWCENWRGGGFSVVRQLELFIEWSSEQLPWDKLSSDRNKCRLRTILLTGLYTLKQLLNIMGPLGNAMSWNCWQGEEASYHVLCHAHLLIRLQ